MSAGGYQPDLEESIIAAQCQAQALGIALVALSERNSPIRRVIDGLPVTILNSQDWDIIHGLADRLIEDVAKIDAVFHGGAGIGERPLVTAYHALNEILPNAIEPVTARVG